MDIKKKLKLIPHSPGVYLMHNKKNEIIYVGKASDLNKRVSSYFNNSSKDIKTSVLISKIEDIKFIVTENELEALILESNLIKKHLPRYNVLLKDDKRYPFLKVTVSEDYPKISIVRERKDDGDLYFGPYTSTKELRATFKLINRIFPIRKCNKKLKIKEINDKYLKPVGKVCLNFQIKQCLAPCQGNINPAQYRKIVNRIILFLKGEDLKLIDDLEKDMALAVKDLDFETAANIRDMLNNIKIVMNKQRIIIDDFDSKDIIAISNKDDIYNITILFMRNGKLMGKDNYIIRETIYADEIYVLTEFIKRYYTTSAYFISEIVVPFDIYENNLVSELISQKRKMVKIRSTDNKTENDLLQIAAENSAIELSNYLADTKLKQGTKSVENLKKVLNLKRVPNIIEGFDISNIQGTNPVASMVRFVNGLPANKEYRKFKIKTVQGINDFKMIYEVVYRRYKRLKNENKDFPDLILIDGGKGQLHSAFNALSKLGLKNLPLISLAKKEELIFIQGKNEPLSLPRNSLALKLLQNIRDEAHRFAVSFHKQLRAKQMLKSKLDDIKGIGVNIRNKIIDKFGSFEQARRASINELCEIKGVTKLIAEDIKNAY